MSSGARTTVLDGWEYIAHVVVSNRSGILAISPVESLLAGTAARRGVVVLQIGVERDS